MRGWALVALAVGTAACGSSSQEIGARLSRPASVAVYRGVTPSTPDPDEPGSYLAVASASGDELRIIDLDSEKPVLAPVQFAPLSVPTGARPALVAAASLADGGPDALVVVPAGTAELQLVETWSAATRVVSGATVDLAQIAPGAEVLTLLATPVPVEEPAGSGQWVAQAGAARFLVGLTGGRLAVVPVTRGPDFSVVLGPVGPADVLDLASLVRPASPPPPFDAVSLALSPGLDRVYLASRDPIDGVLGVAEVDVTASPWNARPLSARAPTYLLAAASVHERPADGGGYEPVARVRIYAALDPTACGADRSIPCGIAVIDPEAGGLLADPAGEMPYATPIRIPGLPVAIALSGPPANGSLDGNPKKEVFPPSSPFPIEILLAAPGTGQQYTSAIAVVPSTDGRAYWLDLSRWRTFSETSVLRSPTDRVRVLSGLSVNGSQGGAFLGACDHYDATECIWDPAKEPVDSFDPVDPTQPQGDPINLPGRISVTPGYTSSDDWIVGWRVPLPHLQQRRGLLGRANGVLYAAVQVPNGSDAPPGSPPFLRVVRLYDPGLGVHAEETHGEADSVEVELDDPSVCDVVPDPDPTEPDVPDVTARALDLLPPDAALHPGGAIALAEPFESPAGGSCPGLSEGEHVPATVTVRTVGLVLYGLGTGYAGRPRLGERYALSYQGEDGLDCPALPTAGCDKVCRAAACEALVLSRKARRVFYLDDVCPSGTFPPVCDPDTGECVSSDPCVGYGFGDPRLDYPHPVGPVVAFWVGTIPIETESGWDHGLTAGAFMRFTTSSGLGPTSRRPASGAAFPSGVVSHDRSTLPGREEDGIRFYVSYPDNQVMSFSPAQAASGIVIIR